MIRVPLNLPDFVAERLAEQADREARTRTEIVRRALDAYFAAADAEEGNRG